jgi:hypothetical protein
MGVRHSKGTITNKVSENFRFCAVGAVQFCGLDRECNGARDDLRRLRCTRESNYSSSGGETDGGSDKK